MERRAEDCAFVVAGEADRRSGALAVGQRVRHSLRRGGRPLYVRQGDGSGARRGAELDAVDLDVFALTGALQHVVDCAASLTERVGPVGNQDCRLDLHGRSIAREEPQDEPNSANGRGAGATRKSRKGGAPPYGYR
jgi:hypothetical protein